jgi:hypothetical protein
MSTSLHAQPDLPFRPGIPLLDQIQLRHGPIPQLGRFFLLADHAARDLGVHLRLHRDMASLADAYPNVQPGRVAPVLPIFDPALSNLSPENAFWISGHDKAGMLVATQAARFCDMTNTNLGREFTSLRLYFSEPENYLAGGARCQVDCPPAFGITGRVIYSGGAVYHPTVRGSGLSRILPRISRALAYSMWDSDYTVSTAEKVLIEKNVHRSYGYTRHAPSIKVSGSNRPDVDVELLWMPREEMLEDLAIYISAAAMNDVRNTEATETNPVPLRYQGSSSRS